MNFYMKLILAVAAVALGAAAHAEDTVKSIKFESLMDFSMRGLPTGTPLALYFFQPECASCARQKKELACLSKNIQVVSFGVFGSKKELAKEARKFDLRGVLVYGGKKAESFFKVRQTPTLIFYSSVGQEIKRVESWLPCEELRSIRLQ